MTAPKNYDGTTSNMRIAFLVPNQAWTVLWHGDPIAIHDRMFWVEKGALIAALESMGLDPQKDGKVLRWCPVGRMLKGYPAERAFLPECPNHAVQTSSYCAAHAALYDV